MIRALFTQSDSILSKIIRNETGEDVSHALLEFPDGIILHSNLLGVQLTTREHLLESGGRIVSEIEVPGITEEQLVAGAEKYVGHWYDYLALLWDGIMYLVPKWARRSKNQWNNPNAFTCTELVTQIIYGEPDSTITPGQLRDKLKQGSK